MHAFGRPIITNPEVIAINQAWMGDAGRSIGTAADTVKAPNCGHGTPCSIPRWLTYAKRLPVPLEHDAWGKSAAAVLLMNNGDAAETVTIDLSQVLLGPCQFYTQTDVTSKSFFFETPLCFMGNSLRRLR
jgi:hypothetical protein